MVNGHVLYLQGSATDAGLNLETLEIHSIRWAFQKSGGKKREASRLLGLSYETLRY